MDTSKVIVAEHQPQHYGADIRLVTRRDITASLSLHPADQHIHEHAHDCVAVTLFLAGSYTERSNAGTFEFHGPAAVIHPPGSAHEDHIGPRGLESVVLALDPAWLSGIQIGCLRSPIYVVGRDLGRDARRLAHAWASRKDAQEHLLAATAIFLSAAMRGREASKAGCLENGRARPRHRRVTQPAWLEKIQLHLAAAPLDVPDSESLAAMHKLHPAWLLQSYRQRVGEGVGDTVRRRRVELAASLLRATGIPIAEIALETGFCDQSHMNRVFTAVLGRSPGQVRAERVLLQDV